MPSVRVTYLDFSVNDGNSEPEPLCVRSRSPRGKRVLGNDDGVAVIRDLRNEIKRMPKKSVQMGR
jgi:hypothetical protein